MVWQAVDDSRLMELTGHWRARSSYVFDSCTIWMVFFSVSRAGYLFDAMNTNFDNHVDADIALACLRGVYVYLDFWLSVVAMLPPLSPMQLKLLSSSLNPNQVGLFLWSIKPVTQSERISKSQFTDFFDNAAANLTAYQVIACIVCKYACVGCSLRCGSSVQEAKCTLLPPRSLLSQANRLYL